MFKIWHPNDIDSAYWFATGAGIPINNNIFIIPTAGSPDFLNLPETIKNILALDKPDLIITASPRGVDIPILSIEITKTTPQSQHAKQRMSRLIAAAEQGIPSIYIIPERKLSGGTMYGLGADLPHCLNTISNINQMPSVYFPYPDNNGVLLNDPTRPGSPLLTDQRTINFFRYVRDIIDYFVNTGSLTNLMFQNFTINKLHHMSASYRNYVPNWENYGTLKKIRTDELPTFLRDNTELTTRWIAQTIADLPKRISQREFTYVFSPEGRILEHAGDPYVGMFGFFDYMFCRSGKHVEDRSSNLVYMPLKEASRSINSEFREKGFGSYYENKCPFSFDTLTVKRQFEIAHALQYGCKFTKSKPLRIYSYFSDLIIFKDGILVF